MADPLRAQIPLGLKTMREDMPRKLKEVAFKHVATTLGESAYTNGMKPLDEIAERIRSRMYKVENKSSLFACELW